jgi:hypothetical protein
MLINFTVSGDRILIRTEAGKNLNYEGLKIEMAAHVECKNKSDTSYGRDSGNCLRFIQKTPEQHTWKTLNKGTTQDSHIGHCTGTSESADPVVLNI